MTIKSKGKGDYLNSEESRNENMHDFSKFIIFFLLAICVLLQTQAFSITEYFGNPVYQYPFNNYNPNKNWCPSATCNNSPLCQPCNRRFLIIIATGRSGSTTLTNMLNLLPNVRMAGENNAHLAFGLLAAENLQTTDAFNLESLEEVHGPWRHHPIPKQSYACPIQHLYEAINPPPEQKLARGDAYDDSDNIIGFKTVRLHGIEFPDDWQYVADYLIENFPCARFVVNIRSDVEEQVESWKKSFGTDLDGDELRYYNRKLVQTAAYMGQDRARLIDMLEWSKKDNSGVVVLNDLIEWLGFVDCSYETLLHSNKDGYGADRNNVSMGSRCRYQGN